MGNIIFVLLPLLIVAIIILHQEHIVNNNRKEIQYEIENNRISHLRKMEMERAETKAKELIGDKNKLAKECLPSAVAQIVIEHNNEVAAEIARGYASSFYGGSGMCSPRSLMFLMYDLGKIGITEKEFEKYLIWLYIVFTQTDNKPSKYYYCLAK